VKAKVRLNHFSPYSTYLFYVQFFNLILSF